MLEIFLKWAIPFLCGGVLTMLGAAVRTLGKKHTALEEGVQCLLRAEIIRCHESCMTKGWCSVAAKESLGRAYAAYTKLGGNDVATELYHQVLALPGREEDVCETAV